MLPDVLVQIAFEKQRSAYNRRAAKFVHGLHAHGRCVFSVIVLTPIATLHWHLFKHCSSRRPRGVDEDLDQKGFDVFDVAPASPSRSRGRSVLNTYEDLFFSPIDSSTRTWITWRPFIRLCGPLEYWAKDLFFYGAGSPPIDDWRIVAAF